MNIRGEFVFDREVAFPDDGLCAADARAAHAAADASGVGAVAGTSGTGSQTAACPRPGRSSE